MTIEHISNSIYKALQGYPKLDEGELDVHGFSTPTQRRLFHNLCEEAGTYLEVGLFCGGTFCSSFNDGLTAIGIEDYSQDFSRQTVKKELEENVEKFKHKAKDVIVHYKDCFKIDKETLPKNIDILFYDAHHDEIYQQMALPYYVDNMADRFLYLVDDYNWKQVSDGTKKGLAELSDKIEIEYEVVLRGTFENNDPIYHNGIAIFLINKK